MTDSKENNLVGQTGHIMLATQGLIGPGKVTLTVAGTTEQYFAWSRDSLSVGTRVLVTEELDPSTLTVQPL
jgi:hypothetical protein